MNDKDPLSIPVYEPWLGPTETDYVNACLSSGWVSSKGEYVELFEESFAAFTGIGHASTVCNGTVALHVALVALGIGPGDYVLVPSFTYVASVNAILQVGAIPQYVEVDPETWQMDLSKLPALINNQTKAVMAVHLYGHSVDLTALRTVCDDYGLLLVEDCAEAFGTRSRGLHVGALADVATFSFFGNKTITTGEGGMVASQRQEVIESVRHLKNQGVSASREYWHDALAFNYRMTNIAAAIGLAQMEKATEILKRKKLVAQEYKSRLQGLPVSFQFTASHCDPSWWMVSILVESSALRDAVRRGLAAANVETRPLFPPCHLMPHSFSPVDLPVTEDLSGRGLNLPSHPHLDSDSIDRIAQVLREVLAV